MLYLSHISYLILSALLINTDIAQTPDKPLSYDFWIGIWDVTWDEGQGKIGKGTNTIEAILDGKVIQENFQISEGQSKGYKGKSMTVYNPNTKLWKQAWTDNNGGYIDFTGDFDEGGNPIFKTATTKKGDQQVVSRMVFKEITTDSFTWDWEGSKDGGETWTLNWRISYKRKIAASKTVASQDFDPMIGTCQCKSERIAADGKTWQSPVDMTWTFKYIMNGTGVQDDFSLTNGLSGGSIRQFNTQKNKWYVHYYSSNSAPSSLTSWEGDKNEKGDIILYSPQQGPSNEEGFLKLRFHDTNESGYKWIGAWVNKDESTVSPFWKISCTKG